MAFPTIPTVGAGRVLTNTDNSASTNRSMPSLSSLTKNAGDLLIYLIAVYQQTTTNATFSGWPTGFTEFLDVGTGGSTMGFGAAYKWSDGTEVNIQQVTQAATVVGQADSMLISIPGAHPISPPEAGSFASGTSAAADPASFAPSWGSDDTLWIALGANGETSTTGSFTGMSTAPTNYGNTVDTGISADVVGGVDFAVAFRQLTASSENIGTWTCDLSNARNAAAVIAIRSAPPPVVPFVVAPRNWNWL